MFCVRLIINSVLVNVMLGRIVALRIGVGRVVNDSGCREVEEGEREEECAKKGSCRCCCWEGPK